ncbi:MAG: RNA-binding protein [Bacteroidota bacterium]
MKEISKVFIGGLPSDVSELELAILISIYGHIQTLKIVQDKKSGSGKAFAFLEMATKKDAENTVTALDGEVFKGHVLTFRIAEESQEKPSRVFKKPSGPASHKPTNTTGHKLKNTKSEEPVAKQKRPRLKT